MDITPEMSRKKAIKNQAMIKIRQTIGKILPPTFQESYLIFFVIILIIDHFITIIIVYLFANPFNRDEAELAILQLCA